MRLTGAYLHALWLYEDVVQAAVKSSHVVGVGRLPAGARQRGEGRDQLHAAGLLQTRAAPVLMLLRDLGLTEQLEHTWSRHDVALTLFMTKRLIKAENSGYGAVSGEVT